MESEANIRIDPKVACHKMKIGPKVKPFKQRLRRIAPNRRAKVNEEVDLLLIDDFINPTEYPRWVSNIVVVPKKNGQVRVCINITNLKKACSRHPYPLPYVENLNDMTVGYKRLTFLDTFLGYNQFPIKEQDEMYTSFIIDRRRYSYKVMPFGLEIMGVSN